MGKVRSAGTNGAAPCVALAGIGRFLLLGLDARSSYPRFRASNSSKVCGRSFPSGRERLLSAKTSPSVCQQIQSCNVSLVVLGRRASLLWSRLVCLQRRCQPSHTLSPQIRDGAESGFTSEAASEAKQSLEEAP